MDNFIDLFDENDLKELESNPIDMEGVSRVSRVITREISEKIISAEKIYISEDVSRQVVKMLLRST